MANVKISALPAAAALVGTEEAPIVQGGATVKATVENIAALAGLGFVLAANVYHVPFVAATPTAHNVTLESPKNAANTSSGNLILQVGDSTTTPGVLSIVGSHASGAGHNGGEVSIVAGLSDAGTGGPLNLFAGNGAAGSGGLVQVFGGDAAGAFFGGGDVHISGGKGPAFGGGVIITGGTATGVASTATAGGDIRLQTGAAAGTIQNSGTIILETNTAAGAGSKAGDIELIPGLGTGGATTGKILLRNLPSADPAVAGALFTLGVPGVGVPRALWVSGG